MQAGTRSYARTAKGTLEVRNRASALAGPLRSVLAALDSACSPDDLAAELGEPRELVQRALHQLECGGYVKRSSGETDASSDLDFTSPAAISRLQAQAEVRARAEAAALARAEEAKREAAAAREREQQEARARAEAEAEAARAARALEEARTAALAADAEKQRAAEQASAASTPELKAAASDRAAAAARAEAAAAEQARSLASAESEARSVLAQAEATEQRARDDARARARAESEAQARAHAEAHARAMVEAQLKAMSAALARAESLAREEADARARLSADLQAREAAEAEGRAAAAARARAEAEAEMRAELSRLREEADRAQAEAEARAEAEREAREAAEARIAREQAAHEAELRRAAEEAEARARAEAEGQLEAQRRAHAAARAAAIARAEEERAAREAAESRAAAEARARIEHESAVLAHADTVVRERVAEELVAREEAQRAEDARYRAAAELRARAAAEQRAPETQPARRRLRRIEPAVLAKLTAAGVLAAAVGAALLVPVVPLDSISDSIERSASEILRQPVHVSTVRYRLLPSPELVLGRVAIGTTYGTRAERVTLSAWPWQLHGSPQFGEVSVYDAAVDREGAQTLSRLLDGATAHVPAKRIVFMGGRLALEDAELPVSTAAIDYTAGGAVRRVVATTGGATVEAVPQGAGRWQVSFSARRWTPPFGPSLEFDSIAVRGTIHDGAMKNASVEAGLAGGELAGVLSADWRDGIRAQGEFELSKADVQRLMSAYTRHFTAQGTLYARGQYVMRAATVAALPRGARVSADFRIARGELANVDLVRALQQVTSKGVQGGRTKFEQLAGTVEVVGDRYRYRQLRLTSGPMTAIGDVEVGAGNELSGRVGAEVSSSSRTAFRGTLAIAGSLSNPILRP